MVMLGIDGKGAARGAVSGGGGSGILDASGGETASATG
jgi:hypothetical protein